MAIFSKKTTKKTPKTDMVVSSASSTKSELSWVLRNPRITEKATDVSGRSVYVFDIGVRANKKEVAEAVFKAYKVRPTRVNIAKVRGKKVRNVRTGIAGKTVGGKKAYVYLKKGETISIM